MLNPKLEKALKAVGVDQEGIDLFKNLEDKPKSAIEVALLATEMLFDNFEFEGEPFISDEQPKEEPKQDVINHPSHYTQASVRLEPIDVLRYAPFDFGNALKYLIRAGHKGNALTDYQKALKYLKWAEESAMVNQDAYQTFYKNYALLLGKFEIFKGWDVNQHEFFGCVHHLRGIPLAKIKELKNEHQN